MTGTGVDLEQREGNEMRSSTALRALIGAVLACGALASSDAVAAADGKAARPEGGERPGETADEHQKTEDKIKKAIKDATSIDPNKQKQMAIAHDVVPSAVKPPPIREVGPDPAAAVVQSLKLRLDMGSPLDTLVPLRPENEDAGQLSVKLNQSTHVFEVFERKDPRSSWKRLDEPMATEHLEAQLRLEASHLSDGNTIVHPVTFEHGAMRILEEGKADVLVADKSQYSSLAKSWANRIVVLSVPRFLGPDARRQVRAMVNDLQRIDPKLRIFVDDPRPGLSTRVQEASTRTVADPINVVVPSEEFQIIDGGALQDLSGALRRANISVTSFAPGQAKFHTKTSLIVIAGHSAEELRKYVDELIRAGAFMGNHVVFASCGTKLTHDLSRKIHEAGASSLLAFDEEITDVEVQQMLKSVLDSRRSNGKEGLVEHLIQWIVNNKVDAVWEAWMPTARGNRYG